LWEISLRGSRKDLKGKTADPVLAENEKLKREIRDRFEKRAPQNKSLKAAFLPAVSVGEQEHTFLR